MEVPEGIVDVLDRARGGDGLQHRIVVEDGQRAQGRPLYPGAMNRRPRLQLIAPEASPEETAAVAAAIEQFMRATAPLPAPPAPRADPWQRAALLEGVARDPHAYLDRY